MANLIIIYQYSNLSFLWTTTTFWVFRKLLQKNKSKRLIRNWLWNTILYVFVNFRIRIVTMYPRPRRNLPKYQRLIRFCQTLSKDDSMMTLRDQMLKGQQIEMPLMIKVITGKIQNLTLRLIILTTREGILFTVVQISTRATTIGKLKSSIPI